MDSTEHSRPKHPREANFTDDKMRVLYEENGTENEIIFSANCSAITQKLKQQIWENTSSKVNACDAAAQTQSKLQDKWKTMKSAVLWVDELMLEF